MEVTSSGFQQRSWRWGGRTGGGIFETPLTREEIALRLRPFNGEYGREGGRFEDKTVNAAVDDKGIQLSMARRATLMRQVTAQARWEPAASGSRFNLKIEPVLSRKVSAIRFALIALVVTIGAFADYLVIQLLDLRPPPYMTFLVGLVTYNLMVLMYLLLVDPIITRRLVGVFEYQQVEQTKRFVVEVLRAREIRDDSHRRGSSF